MRIVRGEEKIDDYRGKTFAFRYKVENYLGKGATSVVYSAYDLNEKREVALKILRAKCKMGGVYINRFKREAKAIGTVKHNNIVNIEKLEVNTETPYIVSEYISGGYLSSCKGYRDWFKLDKVLKYMRQILNAVEYLHNNGIIHKDIRPQNIILGSDDNIKIIDFGVADFPGDEPKLPFYREMGAIHYLSPELIRGDDYDKRTDIYSLGVLFYRLLSGELPFDAKRSVIIGIMHNKKQPKLIKEINPNVPEEICKIAFKALEKSPQERYGSAQEMLNDINAYLQLKQN